MLRKGSGFCETLRRGVEDAKCPARRWPLCVYCLFCISKFLIFSDWLAGFFAEGLLLFDRDLFRGACWLWGLLLECASLMRFGCSASFVRLDCCQHSIFEWTFVY